VQNFAARYGETVFECAVTALSECHPATHYAFFVRCQTGAIRPLMSHRSNTRRTPYVFLSHIANAIDATYRVTDGISVVCISNQYEIGEHISGDGVNVPRHVKAFKPWQVSADNKQDTQTETRHEQHYRA
jgi:hypothetical protein